MVRQAKGAGYAMSRTEELQYMQQVAQATGGLPAACAAAVLSCWRSAEPLLHYESGQ